VEEHQNGLAVTPDAGDLWRKKNIGRNVGSLILGIDGSQSQSSFRSPTKGALIHLFTQFLSSFWLNIIVWAVFTNLAFECMALYKPQHYIRDKQEARPRPS
jgi:hypothetical protein